MVNKAIILGRLARDVKVTYSNGGNAIGNFSVATSEKWTDKSGVKQEKTEFHNVVVFGKLAELCGNYLAKGRQVYIEGKLATDKYNKDGVDHYSTKIVASTVQFIGSPSGDSKQANEQPEQDFTTDDLPF